MNDVIISTGTQLQEVQEISAELFTRWIGFIDARPKTVATYTRAVKQFWMYLQMNNVTKPTRDTVIAYRDFLMKDHKATTVQSYISAVKLFFQWTAQEGIYPNIAERVKGAKIDKGFKKDYLTAKQAKDVLDNIDRSTITGLRDYAILSLMVTAGLRTIEITRANIDDMRTLGEFMALYIQGKGHDEKTDLVKIAEPVEEAIRAYLKARGEKNGKAPLFCSHSDRNRGERLTTRTVSGIAKRNFIAVGLESDRITAHSLRHTAATLNMLRGGKVEETQQLLRHQNINTTLLYSHALSRAKNKSEDRVARAIFG